MPIFLFHSFIRRILGVCKVKIPFCSHFIMEQADQTPVLPFLGVLWKAAAARQSAWRTLASLCRSPINPVPLLRLIAP